MNTMSKVKAENVLSRELMQYLEDKYPRRQSLPSDEFGATQWYSGRQSVIDDLNRELSKIPFNPMRHRS